MKKFISVLLCLSLIFAFTVSGFCSVDTSYEIGNLTLHLYQSSLGSASVDGSIVTVDSGAVYIYSYFNPSSYPSTFVIKVPSNAVSPVDSDTNKLSLRNAFFDSCERYYFDGSNFVLDNSSPSYTSYTDKTAYFVCTLKSSYSGYLVYPDNQYYPTLYPLFESKLLHTGSSLDFSSISIWNGGLSDEPVSDGYTSSLQSGQSFYVNPGYACVIKLGNRYDSSDNIHLDAITGQASRGLAYTSGHNLSFSDSYQPNKIFDVVNNTLLWDSNGSIFKASNHGSKYISASQFSGQYMYLSNPKSAGQLYNTLSSVADNGQMLVIPSFPVEWVKMVMLQENPVFSSIDTTSETLQYVSISSGGAIVDEGYVYSQNNDLDTVGIGGDSSHLSIVPQTSIPDNGASFGDSEKNLIAKLEQLITGREQNVSDVVEQGQGFFGVLSSLFGWLPSDIVALIGSFFAILLIVAVIKLFL